jgi:hypothetical protein
MQPHQQHLQVPYALPPSLGFVPAGNRDPLSHVQPFQQHQTIDMEPLQPSGTLASLDPTLFENAVYSESSHRFPQVVGDGARQHEDFGLQQANPSFARSEMISRKTDLIHLPIQIAEPQPSPTFPDDGVEFWCADGALPVNFPISTSQSFSQSSHSNFPLPTQLMIENQPPVYGPAEPSKHTSSRRSRMANCSKRTVRKARDKPASTRALSKHREVCSKNFQKKTGAPEGMIQTLAFGACVPFVPPDRTKKEQKQARERGTCWFCYLTHQKV